MRRLVASLAVPAVLLLAGAAALAMPGREAGTGTGTAAIDPALARALAEAPPGLLVPAIVVLRAQADPAAAGPVGGGPAAGGQPGGGKAQRGAAVEAVLRDTATVAQADLLRQVTAWREQGAVADVHPLWIFDGIALRATPQVIHAIAARSDVVRIEADRTLTAPAAPARATATVAPTEPNISVVNAPALWSAGRQGQGVVVANLDTGVDATHPDLAARWRGGTGGWYDPNGEHPSVPTDVNGHGTATMGIMVGGAAGGSSIGMAPGATWIAAKIFNDHGVATSTGIHLAMQWLLDPDGNPLTPDAPDVVNNSWTMSSAGCNLDFQPDLRSLRAVGILPVFSAGNFGPTPGTVLSPANNPEAFAVGATDNADVLDTSSSRGPSACGTATTPGLVAPGVNVRTSDLFGGYITASGTSLSAPHVAGALALLLQAFPGTSADRQAAALTAGAVDLGPAGPDSDYGAGRLDVLAAYQWLASAPPDFAVGASPASITVKRTKAAKYTITVVPVGAFTGAVKLKVTGLPTGATKSFVPNPVTGGSGTAIMTIKTTSTTKRGTFTLHITATSGTLVHQITVVLVVT